MTRAACLICRHMVPIVPADWKPDYRGDVYDRYDVRKEINRTKTHQKINCALNPTWLEFFTNHHCGQFGHFEGATGEDAQTFINGSWAAQDNERLTAENVELKRRLERSREISSRRLVKLRASENQ